MPANFQEHVLAIDLGTSGPKVGVVSAQGELCGSAYRRVASIEVEDGGVEHDPEAVWRAVLDASQEALQESGVPRSSVVAIICDSHFSSLVCLGHDGKPVMNLMVWADRRGAKVNRQRHEGYRPDSLWRQFQWLRLHGIPPQDSGIDNISKMRWVQHARPEVYERTAVFLEPMDYITYRLTGRATANPCSAFLMLLTDTRSLGHTEYSSKLLRYSGVDADKLPELLPVDAIVGDVLPAVGAELGLRPDTKVITGLNDTQAGAIGCGAFQGAHAGIVLGSSGVIVTHTPKKKTDVRTGLFSIPSPLPNAYLMTGEGGVAGRALEHFLESLVFADDGFGALRAEDPFGLLEQVAASSPPGSNGVLFLPWMNGSHVPVSDGNIRGGFLNTALNTRRVDLARAVLEGISYLYRQMSDAAKTFTGREFSHYVLYGGGALSDTWSQTMADMLQVPMHRMKNPRLTNCVGLGLLAFARLGRLTFDEIAGMVPIEREFEPNPRLRALYEDQCAAMAMAFKQNKPVFKKLNGMSTGSNKLCSDDKAKDVSP